MLTTLLPRRVALLLFFTFGATTFLPLAFLAFARLSSARTAFGGGFFTDFFGGAAFSAFLLAALLRARRFPLSAAPDEVEEVLGGWF